MLLQRALTFLAVSVVLMGIGWLSNVSWFWEAIRIAAMLCLAIGIALMLLYYVLTPDPTETKALPSAESRWQRDRTAQ
jgi:accessory gene regulator protein AgrB